MNWQNFKQQFAIAYVAAGRNPNDCLQRTLNARHLALALWKELTAADGVEDSTPAVDDYVLCWDDTAAVVLGAEEAIAGVYVGLSSEYPGKHWVKFDEELAVVGNVVKINHQFNQN